MGQMTHGVLYGAKIAELSWTDTDEDEELYDALHSMGADLVFVDADAPYYLAGIWIAVGGSGKDGVPFLEPAVQVYEIPVAYSERYDAAKAAWPQVEAAVATAGVKDFAPPGLWIAETEVA